MKILKLILRGYTRLQLKQITEFVYTPTDSIQIIIGTNGSGKSSILEELSPLPADSKYY
jgi:DNA repair exonuclease SbcCD ATPase subunit